MRIIEAPAKPGMLIGISDYDYQAYMQTYPFLSGPREDLNRSILAELPSAVSVRQPQNICRIEFLADTEYALQPEVMARAHSLFQASGVSDSRIHSALSSIAWKCRDIGPQMRDILAIGSGDGAELILLRAAAPDARIVAVDSYNVIPPGIVMAASVEFLQTNVIDYIERENEHFEVVFSNHVLEHMYDPMRVLAGLRRQLVQGGVMLAGLPLDGETSRAILQHTSLLRLNPTDLGEFDLGHAWKTTTSDLYETVVAAGFKDVRLVQREHHLNYMNPGDETRLRAVNARGKQLNRLIFGPMRQVINTFFGRHPPPLALRLLYGLEHRVWFGSNNLKNRTTPEILVIATVP